MRALRNLPEGAGRVAERFQGVDPQTGEADYWKRGGLAGLLGMPSWDEQSPQDVAMGFAGSVTPSSRLVGMLNKSAPIKAYHGSPHDFDKFDLSKIGTGEGAQAYGHGLYFAESEPVARSYREGLSIQKGGLKFPTFDGGVALPKYANTLALSGDDAASEAARQFQNFLKSEAPGSGRGIHALNFGETSLAEQLDRFSDVMRSQRAQAGPQYGEYYDGVLGGVDKLRKAADQSQPVAGRMYEVNIHADPERFLDWDKPLREQGARVQASIASADHPMAQYWASKSAENPAYNGEDLYTRLGGHGTKVDATEALKRMDIPGIKYLDQGSRGSGSGTSNYVVFDDKLIEILRKYGVLGPLMGGAMAAGAEY